MNSMVIYFKNGRRFNVKKTSYIIAFITLCLFFIMLTNFEKTSFIQFDKAMSDALFGNGLITGFHILGETTAIATIVECFLFY